MNKKAVSLTETFLFKFNYPIMATALISLRFFTFEVITLVYWLHFKLWYCLYLHWHVAVTPWHAPEGPSTSKYHKTIRNVMFLVQIKANQTSLQLSSRSFKFDRFKLFSYLTPKKSPKGANHWKFRKIVDRFVFLVENYAFIPNFSFLLAISLHINILVELYNFYLPSPLKSP